MERMPFSYTVPGAGERPAPYAPADVDSVERNLIGQALNAYMSQTLRGNVEMVKWPAFAAMSHDDQERALRNLEEAQKRLHRVVCKWTPDPIPLDTYRRMVGWPR